MRASLICIGLWLLPFAHAACSPPPPVAIDNPSGLVARLCKKAPGLKRKVLERVIDAYRCASEAGEVGGELVTVIDYSLPSTERRLWVLNLAQAKLVMHELVAHGKGSGENRSTTFSNVNGSKTSSLGVFRTLGTYQGKHGYTLKLRGLEEGINDNAESRAIVLHGAWYVSESFAKKHGRLGRSWGCPAVENSVHQKLIDAIKDGTLLVAYYPDQAWLSSSPLLHCSSLR